MTNPRRHGVCTLVTPKRITKTPRRGALITSLPGTAHEVVIAVAADALMRFAQQDGLVKTSPLYALVEPLDGMPVALLDRKRLVIPSYWIAVRGLHG